MSEHNFNDYPGGLPSLDQERLTGSSTQFAPPSSASNTQQQRSDGRGRPELPSLRAYLSATPKPYQHNSPEQRVRFQSASGGYISQWPSWWPGYGRAPPGHGSVTSTASWHHQGSTSAGHSASVGNNNALSPGRVGPVLNRLPPKLPDATELGLPPTLAPDENAAPTVSEIPKSSGGGTEMTSSAGGSREQPSSAEWNRLAQSDLDSRGQKGSGSSNTDRKTSEVRNKDTAAARKAERRAKREGKKEEAASRTAERQAQTERRKATAALQKSVRQAESDRKKKAAVRNAKMKKAESPNKQEEDERERDGQTVKAEEEELELCINQASGIIQQVLGPRPSQQESNMGSEDSGPMEWDKLVQDIAESIYNSQKTTTRRIYKNDLQMALHRQKQHEEAMLNKEASENTAGYPMMPPLLTNAANVCTSSSQRPHVPPRAFSSQTSRQVSDDRASHASFGSDSAPPHHSR